MLEFAGMDDKVTVLQAARKIKYTTAALYKAIKEGRLPHETSYGRVIVSMADVREYKATLRPKVNGKGKRNATKD